MNCQVCRAEPPVLKKCSGCGVAFYCSAECQAADWATHRPVCKLWDACSPEVVHNPWYTKLNEAPADHIPLPAGGGAFVAVPMGTHGESPLHVAVAAGNVGGVQELLAAGAYVNVEDSRTNSPLYYACTHPGTLGDISVATRLAIAKLLIRAGADTRAMGGFSGMRPAEAARRHGHMDLASLIENSEELKRLTLIQKHMNEKTPPANIALCVRLYVDLVWRAMSVQWFLRVGSPDNTQPHPQVSISSAEEAELVLRDCARRHAYWWAKVMAADL